MSYGELWDRAARVAGGLRGAGVERGDRVAIRMPNGIDWALAFFGAQLAGAVVVPVNTRFTEDEVAYVVGDSEAEFTFVRRRDAARWRARWRSRTSARTTWRRSSTPAERPASRRGR